MKRAALAMPLVILLGACGSLTQAATATAPAATHPTQFTGTQLAAELVPGSALPRGYGYDNSSAFNSGNRPEIGPVKYKLSSVSCYDFAQNFGQPGFGETAMAGNAYATFIGDKTATSFGEYDQAVYQFTDTSAARSWWLGLHSALARCPGLGLGLGPGGSQRFSAVEMPGVQAFRIDVSIIAMKLPGYTGVMRVDECIAVAGQFVFEVDAVGGGRRVPANPTPETVMRALTARVLAT
jgi:hypothetical protein